MPRKGRGGAREGASQTSYSNRTDLNSRGPEPITTAPGQTYGQATLQRQEQQAVPMASVQTPPAPTQSVAPTPAAPTVPGQGPIDLFAPAEHHMIPADLEGPQAQTQNQSANAMQHVASVLDDAATSPYATRQVQELAAFARTVSQ